MVVSRYKYNIIRCPYVGIIQIRLSVEGHTFLSACHTSSRLFYFFISLFIVLEFASNCKCFFTLHFPYFSALVDTASPVALSTTNVRIINSTAAGSAIHAVFTNPAIR